MRKTIGFKIRDMWYNLGEYFAPSDNPAIITEFGKLFIQCLPVMQGERQDNIFLLSSFTVCCCCFVYHIIKFVICLLKNEEAAYCLLKSYTDISA